METFFTIAALLLLFFGVGYLLDKTFNHGIRVLFHVFLEEVRDLIKMKPTLPAINLLFGVLAFIGLVLLVGAVAVSSVFSRAMPQHHSLTFSGDMIILSGLLAMVAYFILSVAFCVLMKKKQER